MRARRLALTALSLVPLACGSTKAGFSPGQDASVPIDASVDTSVGPSDGGSDAPSDVPGFGQNDAPLPSNQLTSLAITPSNSTLTAMNGGSATQQMTATGTYQDGTTKDLTSQVVWSRDQAGIGNISGAGLFTAFGTLGGTETITAVFGSVSATTTLLVKTQFFDNPGQASTAIQTALQGATTPDPNVKFAYPYDGTVFPRGLNETTLQWYGGNIQDEYYIHLKAATFELQSYAQAPQGWFDFTITTWQTFINSTSGPAELTVARWDGTQATTLCDLHWTIANGSMRGTIYYAAYQVLGGAETGQLFRLDPGATAYSDFLGSSFTCPACHTVSAKGNELVMNGDNPPVETSYGYDLGTSTSTFSGYFSDGGTSQWGLSAVSPDGTTVVEDFAPLYGNIGVQTGAFDTGTGNALPSTGLEGHPLWMPAFSPDGSLLAYVDPTTHDLRAYDWDPVAKQASNDRLLVASAANSSYPQIQYPTVSPDHQWIVYQRGTALGSLGVPGDLYVTPVTSPAEMQLNTVDGTSYPFAAGARDLHLNYEPTFAPVAAGGYFWLVFHSRRTFGTKLTGVPYISKGDGLKQLWVAAFDQAPAAGADPSHPAFYLAGQSDIMLNTRGYWALAPCKADGQPCTSGTDCCGGYCDVPDGGGAPICEPSPPNGCANDGDKCQHTGDCCNAAKGVTCINGVCSEPPPEGGAL